MNSEISYHNILTIIILKLSEKDDIKKITKIEYDALYPKAINVCIEFLNKKCNT